MRKFGSVLKGFKARSAGESDHDLDEGPEMIIVVMGATGTGKSSLINKITGKDVMKIGHNLESLTRDIETTSWTFQRRQILLVDTPGFDDTFLSDTEVLAMIAEYLEQLYRRQVQVNGILYLHRITDPRIGGSVLKNLRMFQKLCGNDSLKNVILVTTFWDQIPPDVGERREKELVLGPMFWKPMVERGSKVHRYHLNKSKATDIVKEVLRNQTTILDIQKELVDQHLVLKDTSAGQALTEDYSQHIRKLEAELTEIQEEVKKIKLEANGQTQNDNEWLKELAIIEDGIKDQITGLKQWLK